MLLRTKIIIAASVFMLGVAVGVGCTLAAGGKQQADIKQRADSCFESLLRVSHRAAALATSLDASRADAARIKLNLDSATTQVDQLIAANRQLAKQLNLVGSGIEGVGSGVDRIESVIREVQKRGDIQITPSRR